ncbi:MAG: RES domain-containing protein [Verrucomicrobiia bacterium]
MGLKCCVNCFAHEWLRDYVRCKSTAVWDCDYCGHEGVNVIPVGALYGLFENLMELYVPSDSPHGEALVDLIQGDYEVFEDSLHTSGEAARLLEDIMESGWDDDSGEPPVDANELYRRRDEEEHHTTMREAWEEFCYELRDNPTHEPNLPALFDEELARMEVELSHESIMHRARIGFRVGEHNDARPFEGVDIGAPPLDKAKPGRANAQGEVVLYVADQEATAVAEVRPWRGLLVSVAEARIAHNLRLVDLSKVPELLNPFTAEAPQYEAELVSLLAAFSEELGRPLRRADDPLDYLPCQKLVRRIRASGLYDGIRYPSAMNPRGTNVVIFDPKLTAIGRSRLVEVREVGISYEPFEDR